MPPPRAIPRSKARGANGHWCTRSRGTAAGVLWAGIVAAEFRAEEETMLDPFKREPAGDTSDGAAGDTDT